MNQLVAHFEATWMLSFVSCAMGAEAKSISLDVYVSVDMRMFLFRRSKGALRPLLYDTRHQVNGSV